jgi:alanine-glyoxylate transaminase/serine-glyoxylate transaminase/serine-pyruvate transaminase
MKAYEADTTAYFAAPPVNLIYAYHASLSHITQGPVSLEERFKAHKDASRRFKKAAEDLGFKGVPFSEEVSANGMTAVRLFSFWARFLIFTRLQPHEQLYFPDGLVGSDIIPRLLEQGIVVAGGIHSSIKGQLRITCSDFHLSELLTVKLSS